MQACLTCGWILIWIELELKFLFERGSMNSAGHLVACFDSDLLVSQFDTLFLWTLGGRWDIALRSCFVLGLHRRLGTHLVTEVNPCERLQLCEFLIRLPSFRGCWITLKQSFLVFMLTPKVLRQWMLELVCVLWGSFSLATAP